jgi:HSP20 family protein
MSITRHETAQTVSSLREAFDRLLVASGRAIDEGVAHSPTLELLTVGQPLPMDVYESETEYILDAAIPGVPVAAVSISASSQSIIVRAEWKRGMRATEQPGRYLRHERFEGEMERRIALPFPIDPERVTTAYANGVLTLRARKILQDQPTHVDVREELPGSSSVEHVERPDRPERAAPLW